MSEARKQLEDFIAAWQEMAAGSKASFVRLVGHLAAQPGVTTDFQARPGLTYSLRASHATRKDRAMFAMVDVIEADPRWLSVCFYDELINDPEERGDVVPGGLLGEDARCFDLEGYDGASLSDVEARLTEACRNAGST
jgi:hypothetical protein